MNRTLDFREILAQKQNINGNTEDRRPKPANSDGFVSEAYNVLNYINTLTRMLASIRKPYLDVNSRSVPTSRLPSRTFNLDATDSWANTRQLTNEERDQIDLQARTILSRCDDRVREMEAIEKRRAELVASQVNPLARFLPTALRQDSSTLSSGVIAAHHASITWYLSRRLAEASQSQKEMQEERIKRQMERSRTLGSGATREALVFKSVNSLPPPQVASKARWLGDASSSLLAAAVGAAPDSAPTLKYDSSAVLSDDDDDEIELSESQAMQFEKENSDLLQSVQETLESVQQAESRLLDISALQMELISHLTRQTELTDQLYEDAIATTTMVEKGNVQLRETRRRSKDSRLFILVFLIGASLSLLFLHYY